MQKQCEHSQDSTSDKVPRIGEADTPILIACNLAVEYPNHLICVQSGSFFHAFDKSAYLLHRLKKYKIKLVGTAPSLHIQAGFPVKNHRKILWHIQQECRVSYVIAEGSKSRKYEISVCKAVRESRVFQEIDDNLVQSIVEDLTAGEAISNSKAVYAILKEEETFRLKSLSQDIYECILSDIQKMPKNYRETFGQNLLNCLDSILALSFDYALSSTKLIIIQNLSSLLDRCKFYIKLMYDTKLIDGKKFAFRAAKAVELSSIIGGLLKKLQSRISVEGYR